MVKREMKTVRQNAIGRATLGIASRDTLRACHNHGHHVQETLQTKFSEKNRPRRRRNWR